MRIFYIVSSLEGGGAEFVIPAIFRALAEARHEVRLLFCEPRDRSAERHLVQAGLNFTLLSREGEARGLSLWRLDRLVRRERPDLIWTSLPRATFEGQVVGRLRGVPVISWQHSAYIRPYKRWLAPILQRLSHLWVADSHGVADFLKERMRVAPARVMTWPLFIAPNDQPQAAPWNGEEPFRIGSVGRLSPHKDYLTLLAAYAHLRTVAPWLYERSRLAIAGAGPEEQSLRRAARQLGIADRFELLGFLADPRKFLSGLHIYAQPSKMEGMCIAAHEAMSAGPPVIATPVGELRNSIISGETGFLVRHGDFATLASRFAELEVDPHRAHLMGVAARKLMLERYGADRFDAAPAAILQKMEAKRPSAASLHESTA
ncbi:glycosyltransferase [Flavisphingomonas formosensis]|uniref:glycosyltransferase n=1 Tax=Flavisphingomonas formosensis TaxID=861534 RepID=UPI0012F9FD5B|nr:glycosyltransferase [Sphingomonas formosensis]